VVRLEPVLQVPLALSCSPLLFLDIESPLRCGHDGLRERLPPLRETDELIFRQRAQGPGPPFDLRDCFQRRPLGPEDGLIGLRPEAEGRVVRALVSDRSG
jgi:hypothetical protein